MSHDEDKGIDAPHFLQLINHYTNRYPDLTKKLYSFTQELSTLLKIEIPNFQLYKKGSLDIKGQNSDIKIFYIDKNKEVGISFPSLKEKGNFMEAMSKKMSNTEDVFYHNSVWSKVIFIKSSKGMRSLGVYIAKNGEVAINFNDNSLAEFFLNELRLNKFACTYGTSAIYCEALANEKIITIPTDEQLSFVEYVSNKNTVSKGLGK
jgi:hypothetical protein